VSDEDRERLRALGYVGSQPATATGAGADALADPKDKVAVLERYRAALELVRSGRMAAAIREFQGIAADNPGMADVWDELGGLLLRQGRLAEAVEAYRREVEATPHNPAALVSVAQALVQLGRNEEAAAQARAALDLLPPQESRWRAAARVVLMRVALARNDPAAARAEATRARETDAGSPLPDFVEGLIMYESGQYAVAVPHFEAALASSRTRTFQVPELRYYLGDALGRLERYAEAEPVLLDQIRLFPSDLRARASLAMLYRAQGRIGDSDQAIGTMLRVAPTAEAYDLAERLWTMFGEPGRAAAARAAARQASSESR
jgi:tetratricopeptide (TPR) repeat protein